MAETKYGKYIFKDPKAQEMPQRRTTQAGAITLYISFKSRRVRALQAG